ncbi:MAG: serine/threonine-protein kinase [Myxococcota bacterium]
MRMEDGIPKKIGRYTVDRLLGSGAMGFVFLGRDPELDRPVAIKTVRDLKMEPEALSLFLERFRNEARAAARLHHPNIVQVYDVGEEDEVGPYLVFEYVAGSTLKKVLKSKGALDPVQVVRLAEEVGESLTLAHEHEIIHRDIKPDNLLVTPDGQTKLADFGVARMPNATLTREGQFLGTPCYAAPETLSRGQYGPLSDLFSFAAVIYEATSGARAFPGQDAVAVAHKVIHDEPVPVREAAESGAQIPKRVEAIIMQGLSKDPQNRYPSAADFADAIREAYEAAGLVEPADLARPPSRRIPVAAQPQRGGRSGWAFATVLAGGLAVGIGIVAFNTDTGAIAPPDAAVDAALVTEDAAPEDAGIDAPPDAVDAAEEAEEDEDAGVDSAVEAVELDPFEREEAAKDALDRARDAIADQDAEAATEALEEARRYDPENPDIEELLREIAALAPEATET